MDELKGTTAQHSAPEGEEGKAVRDILIAAEAIAAEAQAGGRKSKRKSRRKSKRKSRRSKTRARRR
jgi:hypothetical protein